MLWAGMMIWRSRFAECRQRQGFRVGQAHDYPIRTEPNEHMELPRWHTQFRNDPQVGAWARALSASSKK